MYFALIAIDKQLRLDNREAHIAYLEKTGVVVACSNSDNLTG